MNCLSLAKTFFILTPTSLLIKTPELFFPYVFGKNMFFRLLVLISLFFFTLARKEHIKLGLNKFEISFLVYTAILLLAALSGIAPGVSIFSNLERFNGIEGQVYLFLFLYLSSRLLDHVKWWNLIFGILILISLLINIDTFIQHGTDIATGYGSLFGSKNYLAGFDFSIFTISIFLYLTNKEQIWAKACMTVGLLALFIALITFTRAPLLGFALAFVLWFTIFGYKSVQSRRWFIPAIVTIGLTGLGFILKFSDKLLHTANMRSRLDMWEISLKGFQESPLLGVGPENFGYLFDRYHPGQYPLQLEQWIDNAHNILFNTLSEAGLFGLISFLIMVFILFQSAFRRCKQQNTDQILFFTLIMLYIEQLFIINPISQNIPQFLIISYLTKQLIPIEVIKRKNKSFTFPVKIIICLIIVSISYKTIVLETYRHYQFSKIYQNFPKNLPRTIADLIQYFNSPPIRYTYLTQKMATDVIKVEVLNQAPRQFITIYVQLIIDQLNKIIALNPKNIRTQVILGGVYMRFDPSKSVSIYQNIIKQAPKKPINYVYLAHAYLRIGNKESAKESLRLSLKLDPTFRISKEILDGL